ncbi:MAG: TonB-dependent receptor [Armatimonadetes bacterium]|nr:TonB-dependent receptor [Armatimonadota bacterium]
MIRKIAVLGLFLVFLLTSLVFAEDKENQAKGVFDTFSDDVTVETGAKMPVLRREAPYSVTLITSEDLERYRPQSFADLFQRVPGVDVLPLNASFFWMTVRDVYGGFLHQNRITVLIDDVPLFVNLASVNFLDAMPVNIQDVESIELIRTPTTISGVSAVQGIISIKTKAARNASAFRAEGSIGDGETNYGYLGFGGKGDRASYRISAVSSQSDLWRSSELDRPQLVLKPGDPYVRKTNLSSRLDYPLSPSSSLGLLFGRTERSSIYEEDSPFVVLPNIAQNLLALTYTRAMGEDSQLKLRFSHTALSSNWETQYFDRGLPLLYAEERSELALEHFFPWAHANLLSWGGNIYRYTTRSSRDTTPPYVVAATKDKLSLHYKDTNEMGWGLYFQNKHDFTPKTFLFLGGRLDSYWTGQGNFAPFASLVHKTAPGRSFRLNANTGYRYPESHELLANLAFLFTPAASSPLPSGGFFYGAEFATGQGLSPEKVTSFEAAYGGSFSPRFKGEVELYHKKTENYILRRDFEGPMTLDHPLGFQVLPNPPAMALTPPPFPISAPPFFTIGVDLDGDGVYDAAFVPGGGILPVNIPWIQVTGGEISGEYLLKEWAALYGNFRYQKAKMRLTPELAAILGLPEESEVRTAARDIYTLGVKLDLRHDVKGFIEAVQTGERILRRNIPARTVVDAGISFPLAERLKGGLWGYNIFDSRIVDNWNTIKPGRRLYLVLTYDL